jgi:hypothetical protein
MEAGRKSETANICCICHRLWSALPNDGYTWQGCGHSWPTDCFLDLINCADTEPVATATQRWWPDYNEKTHTFCPMKTCQRSKRSKFIIWLLFCCCS